MPEEEAELHVINTCCITGEAEAKSRQSVRRSLKTARTVYVGGCAVNLHAAQFAEIDEAVRPFTGTAEDVAQAMAGALGDVWIWSTSRSWAARGSLGGGRRREHARWHPRIGERRAALVAS